MKERVEIRQPLLLRIYIIGFGVVWVGLLIRSIVTSPESGIGVAIVMIVIGVAFMTRIASLKCVADGSGLFVRNFFSSRRLAWAQVEDFRLGRPMAAPFGYVIHVLLLDGGVLTLDATAWGLFGRGNTKRERALASLRAWLP